MYVALHEVTHMVHGYVVYTDRAETAAFSRGTSPVTTKGRCKDASLVGTEKATETHRDYVCDKSALSLFESGDQRCIKAMNNG